MLMLEIIQRSFRAKDPTDLCYFFQVVYQNLENRAIRIHNRTR